MRVEERVAALAALGERVRQALNDNSIETVLYSAKAENGWFTPENSRSALNAILSEYLDEQKIRQWISAYDIPDDLTQRNVGLVLAGNIPLVGWHDVMAVLMSGHKAVIKLSSKDTALMKWMLQNLSEVSPEMGERYLVADRLKGFDAVIATGSGNTAHYFDYYFRKYPHIIRRNRTGIAVLNGEENAGELAALGKDIFSYFGLGCRNVSKVYVPKGYDFTAFFEAVEVYKDIINHNKYHNNYEYHKSILLLNREPHLDNGFLLLKKDNALCASVASLHYEEYGEIEEMKEAIKRNAGAIQCVVARPGVVEGALPFGATQQPGLADYADGVDTMAFLLSLN